MTAFVILAAGRGSRLGRIGDDLPKCLLPINGQAAISHQFALAPTDARLIVVTGYRATQVEEYVRLAHPDLDVTFVNEVNWGRGPGASLLEARDAVGDDGMVFVACDTLWERDDDLWVGDASWVATAPIPAGTPAARWCRIVSDATGSYAIGIDDKTPDVKPDSLCWTALGYIARDELPRFWNALTNADNVAGEIQMSSGMQAVLDGGWPMRVKPIRWLDIGDERAFRAAIATYGGYDPLKPDQITYVRENGRVVKWHVNEDKVHWRADRAKELVGLVPPIVDRVGSSMVAYDYVPGALLYDVANQDADSVVTSVLDWWSDHFWSTYDQHAEFPVGYRDTSMKFYRDKTFSRVMSLDAPLRSVALDAITRVDWDKLVEGVVPGTFHGDFTYSNIITYDDDWNTKYVTIDWREDYAGVTSWGDLRYDLGKLLSGTVFHWQNASHGDFRRWQLGPLHRKAIEIYVGEHFDVDVIDIQRIAALCLINSAALHASPMDEILVARGTQWLAEVT